MRENGYYFVMFQGVSYIDECWSLAGNINICHDDDFDYIDVKNCFMYCKYIPYIEKIIE